MARHYGANHRQQHKRDSEIFGFYKSMRSYIESVLAFKMGSNTHHINVDDTVLFCSRLFAGCTAFFGIVTDLLETVVVLSCACVFSTQLGSIRRSPHETHVSILTAVRLRLLLLLPGLILLCFYSFFFFFTVCPIDAMHTYRAPFTLFSAGRWLCHNGHDMRTRTYVMARAAPNLGAHFTIVFSLILLFVCLTVVFRLPGQEEDK